MCSEGLRERYVNPYTDFAFKLLFGTDLNKEILIGFLNALFDGKQVIEDVIYLPALAAGIIGDTVLNLWVNHYVDCKYPFLVKMKKEKRF